jgi:hypothetical protein
MTIKFNSELLELFCKEYNIIVLEKSHENINCNTKLKAKCINETCNEQFNKKFHVLYKSKIFTCKQCTINISKQKQINTNIVKYGVKFICQSSKIKEKKRETCLQKYGVDNVSKNKDIINKMKETNNLNYFNKYNKISPSILTTDKKNQIILDKYGTLNFRSSDYIKNKIKQTVMNKYGVDHISKSKDIQLLKIENCLNKYGVEHNSQRPDIADKITRGSFMLKEYTFPSGRIDKVQGYEPYALNELINSYEIDENDIITGVKNVPEIWYYDINQKKHRHYVDIFLKSQNKCIEVKSSWTVKLLNVFNKQQAAKELGYLYEIWVYNEKGKIIDKHI